MGPFESPLPWPDTRSQSFEGLKGASVNLNKEQREMDSKFLKERKKCFGFYSGIIYSKSFYYDTFFGMDHVWREFVNNVI